MAPVAAMLAIAARMDAVGFTWSERRESALESSDGEDLLMTQPFRTSDKLARFGTCQSAARRSSEHSPLAVHTAMQEPVVSATEDVTQQALVHRLAHEVRCLETAGRKVTSTEVISSGCEALDACLPHGGYVPGSVVEYLRGSTACGASYMAVAAAAAAMRARSGYVVIVDTHYSPTNDQPAPFDQQVQGPAKYWEPKTTTHLTYPPALASQGIDLERVIFVRPQSADDAMWAIDQALRTPAVAAVMAELERIDDRSARRLQLAAETGGSLALLLRPASARRAPSWAEIQWLVNTRPAVPASSPLQSKPVHSSMQSVNGNASRRLQVQLLRNRGGRPGAKLDLEIDPISGTLQPASTERNRYEQTASLRLASELARPKNSGRRTAAG